MSNDKMREALEAALHATFSQDLAGGYITRDKQYALELLGEALERADLSQREAAQGAEPVAWVEVIDTHEGPYIFHGIELLPKGRHHLYLAAPSPSVPAEWPAKVAAEMFPENRVTVGKLTLDQNYAQRESAREIAEQLVALLASVNTSPERVQETAKSEHVVPEGMVLVPRAPTRAMWDAWDSSPFNEDDQTERNNAWAALLAGAPAAATEGSTQTGLKLAADYIRKQLYTTTLTTAALTR